MIFLKYFALLCMTLLFVNCHSSSSYRQPKNEACIINKTNEFVSFNGSVSGGMSSMNNNSGNRFCFPKDITVGEIKFTDHTSYQCSYKIPKGYSAKIYKTRCYRSNQ